MTAVTVWLSDSLIPAVSSVIDFFTTWAPLFTILAIGAGAYAAALLILNGAMIASKVAMVAATVAQWAMNVAMMANPIGLVVAAIVALVAGLIWFFTQTELGQEIWANFTSFLGDAFTWLWENILKPVIDAIAAAFTWLWENIIMPVVNFIISYINLWAAIITWLWENVLSPIFGFIGAIFEWLWKNVIMPVVNFIIAYIQTLGAIFNWLWTNVIKPVADFIGSAINLVGQVIGKVFGAVGDTIRGAFEGVVGFIKGVINSIIDVINGALGGINSLIKAVNNVPGVNFPTIPKIPRLEKGGTLSKGGVALVGERGPEFVTLPTGATVHPNGTGIGNAGGGGGVVIEHVTLDLSKVRNVADLLDLFEGLGQTARQGRSISPAGV